MKRLLLAGLVILTSLVACVEADKIADAVKDGSKELCETIGNGPVSAVSAVLKGKANPGKSAASDWIVGFQYSKSAGIMPANSTTVEAEDADADYNYSVAITGLDPATTYYFRSFVRQHGQDTYGETKEFTTKEVASMLETVDATDIEATKATIRAKVDLADVICKSSAYGFLWGESEDAINTDLVCAEIVKDSISAVLTDLSAATQYCYKAYLKVDDQTFFGEGKTFTSGVMSVEGISLDKMEYTFHVIGDTLTLKATVLPADATDKGVEWSSDKEDVATVDASGKVTAKGNGTATITVTTKDQGKTASCVITVSQWVTSITLNETALTLNEGQEQTLTVTINPSNANDPSITWTSSDESVAKVDQAGKVTAISKGTATIKAEANDGSGVNAACEVEVKQYVTSITLSKTSLSLSVGEEETISVTSVLPDNASDKTFTWSSSDNTVASVDQNGKVTAKAKGNAVIKATANDGSGVFASCAVRVKNPCPSGAVDLGLGVYWATCNLNESGFVSSPEAYGDYYAWGETETKSDYSWSTYKFGTSSSGPFSKYNTKSSYGAIDNKTTLETGPNGDDVASKKLGGNWRMPTHEEWTELLTNCTWTWTSNYNGTGVAGRIVTSNVDGYKDKSIFLPAAGNRNGTKLYYAVSHGCYWSSSLSTGYPSSAWYVYFNSSGVNGDNGGRYIGFSVRPVSE